MDLLDLVNLSRWDVVEKQCIKLSLILPQHSLFINKHFCFSYETIYFSMYKEDLPLNFLTGMSAARFFFFLFLFCVLLSQLLLLLSLNNMSFKSNSISCPLSSIKVEGLGGDNLSEKIGFWSTWKRKLNMFSCYLNIW